MYDANINRMKYFQPFENISFYLYVNHTWFKCTILMCKKHKLVIYLFFAWFALSKCGFRSLWCTLNEKVKLYLNNYITIAK
jgi:hypothetical protein